MVYKRHSHRTKKRSVNHKRNSKRSVNRNRKRSSKRRIVNKNTRIRIVRNNKRRLHRLYGGDAFIDKIKIFTSFLNLPKNAININYRISGSTNIVNNIINKINNNEYVNLLIFDIDNVTSAFKKLIRDNEIISAYEYEQLMDSFVQKDYNSLIKQFVLLRNIDSVKEILKHLRRVWEIQQERDGITTIENLSIVFAPTLFKGTDALAELTNIEKKKELFKFAFNNYRHFDQYKEDIIEPRKQQLSPLGIKRKQLSFDSDEDLSQ